jgi:AhpD family alkylhydroperoxidase
MAHIELTEALPVITGPMVFSPETTKPLGKPVQALPTGPHTLTPAERDMIATYVYSQNDCCYCQTCHGSTAAQHHGGSNPDYELIAQIKNNYEVFPLSAKMKVRLAIAGKVRKGGRYVPQKMSSEPCVLPPSQ